jgi:hypothetical protein
LKNHVDEHFDELFGGLGLAIPLVECSPFLFSAHGTPPLALKADLASRTAWSPARTAGAREGVPGRVERHQRGLPVVILDHGHHLQHGVDLSRLRVVISMMIMIAMLMASAGCVVTTMTIK